MPDTNTNQTAIPAGSADASPPAARALEPNIDWGTYLAFKNFNDVRSNPNLPAGFREKLVSHPYADTFADLNTSPADAVYCTDVRNHNVLPHSLPGHPPLVQSSAPTPNITPAMVPLLTYVLTLGEKYADVDADGNAGSNTDRQENQLATQLAVWLIVEGVFTCANRDTPAIDSVLGGTTSPTTQFATTRRMGDKARKLLNYACDNGNAPLPIYPSFASTSPQTAQSFDMPQPGSGALVIDDNYGTIRAFPSALKVTDAAGLSVSIGADALIVSGDPGPSCSTITLSSTAKAGSLLYLSTSDTAPNGQPYQKQVRYVKSTGSPIPLYVKVCRAGDPNSGSVTIRKSINPTTITDPDIANQDFTFHLFGTDSQGQVTDYGPKTVPVDGTVTFDALPLDSTYTLSEDTPLSNASWNFALATVPDSSLELPYWSDLLTAQHTAANVGVLNQYIPTGTPTGDLVLTKAVDPPAAAGAKKDQYAIELVATSKDGTKTSYYAQLSPGDKVTFTSLPTDHTYSLLETNLNIPGYSFVSATANGIDISSWSTAVSDIAPTPVTLQNNYDMPQTGTLTVDKSIFPSTIQDPEITGQTFIFRLYGRDRSGKTTDYGIKTVGAGSSAIFDNLPLDQIYSLTENVPLSNGNWTFRSVTVPAAGMNLSNWTDLIDSSHLDSYVAVQNNYTPYVGPTGDITVNKRVDPPEAASAMVGRYSLELAGSAQDGSVTIWPGTINPNGTLTFSSLPTDLTYTLHETDTDIPGYVFLDAKANGVDLAGFSTKVTDSTTRVIDLQNNYRPDSVPATITVRKAMDPPGLGSQARFTFRLNEVALDGSLIPMDSAVIQEGESHTFTGLSPSTTYAIIEDTPADIPDWRYAFTDFDGTPRLLAYLTPTDADPDPKTIATNHYVQQKPQYGSITVCKRVCPCNAHGDGVFTFTLTGESNDKSSSYGPYSMTVAAGKSVTFEDLPLEMTYRLVEEGTAGQGSWHFEGASVTSQTSRNVPIPDWSGSLDDSRQTMTLCVENRYCQCRPRCKRKSQRQQRH